MYVDNHLEANAALLTNFGQMATAFGELNLTEKFMAIATSTVEAEKNSQILELAYANHESLPQDVKDAVADIGDYATRSAFYGLGEGGRGAAMVRVLREGGDGPEPVERYKAPPVELPAPPPGMEGSP